MRTVASIAVVWLSIMIVAAVFRPTEAQEFRAAPVAVSALAQHRGQWMLSGATDAGTERNEQVLTELERSRLTLIHNNGQRYVTVEAQKNNGPVKIRLKSQTSITVQAYRVIVYRDGPGTAAGHFIILE